MNVQPMTSQTQLFQTHTVNLSYTSSCDTNELLRHTETERERQKESAKNVKRELYLELPQCVVALLLTRCLLRAHGDQLVDAVSHGTVKTNAEKQEM